jgi:hypothetical protein
MEPTLQHGDIVLVRKSDFYGWHSTTKTPVAAAPPPSPAVAAPKTTRTRTNNGNPTSTTSSSSSTTTTTAVAAEAAAADAQPPSSPEHDARNAADLKLQHHQNQERIQVQKFEAQHCHNPSNSNMFWLIQKPPLAVTGQVVVYRNPQEFPSSWNIKRAIGVGGQVVRTV